MISLTHIHWRRGIAGLVILVTVMLVACGGSATSTAVPPTLAPAATSEPTPVATEVPARGAVSGKDSIILVLSAEPPQLGVHDSGGGITASVHLDNMADPLTWQSGDDQRIVPTSATTGWEQLGPSKWRFELRRGVKFHNGEAWNAQAALPSLEFLASPTNTNPSFAYTGAYSAEAVGEYSLDLTCSDPCPIFPNTSFFVNFTAPDFFNTSSDEVKARQAVSFGPYKQVEWDFGVSITQEAYEDYVPAGDHFEFQKPVIQNVRWIFRGEPQVMAAVVQTGEADIAWDVGVDALDVLNPDQIKSGGSAETFTMGMLSAFHPELRKQKVRLALNHAVNCQELIDSLYGGNSVCRGNIIWPGVIGATEANTAPYEFNPQLARQLLEEANYDFNTTIKLTSRGTRIPKQIEVLETIQSFLADVGVKVDLNIVEVQAFLDVRNCRSGQAVVDLFEERGITKDPSDATLEEFQAALAVAQARGSTSCPSSGLIENEPSNETLDYGRQVTFYLNCAKAQSPFCDPSPGGIQSKIAPALGASGAERQRLLEELADFSRAQSLWLSPFDLPVIYAVNPDLVWEPRFDRRVRINAMRFK